MIICVDQIYEDLFTCEKFCWNVLNYSGFFLQVSNGNAMVTALEQKACSLNVY